MLFLKKKSSNLENYCWFGLCTSLINQLPEFWTRKVVVWRCHFKAKINEYYFIEFPINFSDLSLYYHFFLCIKEHSFYQTDFVLSDVHSQHNLGPLYSWKYYSSLLVDSLLFIATVSNSSFPNVLNFSFSQNSR